LASDLLVGILVGIILMGILNPYRGVYFYIRELRKQLAFLKADTAESGVAFDKEFPNRKENS